MYKVIREFHDLQDCVSTKGGRIFHKYNVGDEYPRKGKTASSDRIEELASDENAQQTPLIKEVYNGSAVDLTKMTKDELIQFAEENGIKVDKRAKVGTILDTIMLAPSTEDPEGGEGDAE